MFSNKGKFTTSRRSIACCLVKTDYISQEKQKAVYLFVQIVKCLQVSF